MEEILILLIHETTDKSKKYLNENKSLIRDIYTQAEHNNLRHVRQILLDFEYLIRLIDEKYLVNQNFCIALIKVSFLLSIEIKAGNFNKDELLNHDNIVRYGPDEGQEDTNFKKLLKKYKSINQYNLIFSQQLLVEILFETNIDKNKLNDEISNSQYFEKKVEIESWKRIWSYYMDLDYNEFDECLKDVVDKFNNNEYIEHGELLHVFGILLGLSRNGLYNMNIGDLIKKQKENIKHLINDNLWKENLYEYDDFAYNLQYHEDESSEFEEIKKYIEEQSQISFDRGLPNKARDLLVQYSDKKFEELSNKLEREFLNIAIFSKLDYNEYIKMIHETQHKDLVHIFNPYRVRYEKVRLEKNSKLKNDLKFWENVYENILNGIVVDTQPFKYFILASFQEDIKKEIIDKISELSE